VGFVFLCDARGFEKHGFPIKENCNLSGNGCKVRGRVGGVAAERILFGAPKRKVAFVRLFLFVLFFLHCSLLTFLLKN